MDEQGDERWIWDGAENYSASWVGVDNFYAYASGNQGNGLAASTNLSYYNGEEGDLICMGSETDWNHIVMIAQVIKDEQGNTVDYLINSNTSDVKKVRAFQLPPPPAPPAPPAPAPASENPGPGDSGSGDIGKKSCRSTFPGRRAGEEGGI